MHDKPGNLSKAHALIVPGDFTWEALAIQVGPWPACGEGIVVSMLERLIRLRFKLKVAFTDSGSEFSSRIMGF